MSVWTHKSIGDGKAQLVDAAGRVLHDDSGPVVVSMPVGGGTPGLSIPGGSSGGPSGVAAATTARPSDVAIAERLGLDAKTPAEASRLITLLETTPDGARRVKDARRAG